MSTTDFSRTFLREGYDMSEVRAFLADVERTIRGQTSEPDEIVTARKAEEIEFSVKFRGFNMDQVDAEIDRLIGVLRGLDRDREWAAQREGEAGEEVSAAHAHEPAPASLTDSRRNSFRSLSGARNSFRSLSGARRLRHLANRPWDAYTPGGFW